MSRENPASSYLGSFHNQKDLDFDPRNGIINSPGSEKHLKQKKLQDSERFNKEVGETSSLEKQIENVIRLINKMELQDSYKNDKGQAQLLAKNKELAKNKIREMLNYLENYMIAINKLDTVKAEREMHDNEKYKELFRKAEDDREMRHKLLYRSLLSTIKFISHSFGIISEEAVEKWEAEREENDLPVLHVKRVKFPDKVLCPDNVSLKDRKGIYPWAVQLAHSLGKLKNGLT